VLVAAAVCPHPVLLVPQVASRASAELDDLRALCQRAVDVVTSSDARIVFVVGADIGLRATSFAPWGVDVPVDVPEPMPLSLLVGAWLTTGVVRSFVVVEPTLTPAECAELGGELAGAADRVGLLVMGDGSARHDVKAPGYLDAAAAPYDDNVESIFATGSLASLLDLDPVTSDQLMVAGRAPWQVLAGAASECGDAAGVVHARQQPYGVAYHVAAWRWQ
jgi:aromatic ring-opening dioxygenase LigB subunit